MARIRPWLLALSSALLFALALPNQGRLLGLWPLGWLALIPLYLALLEAKSYRRAALLTAVYGAAQHAASSYWLYFFRDYAFWTIGLTTIAYFVVYLLLGLCLALLLRRSGPHRPLAFALAWASFEFCKSSGFLAYPWGLLPYTQSTLLPLLQVADLTGVYGLSFLLALGNAGLAELLWGGGDPTLGPLGRGRLRYEAPRRGSFSARVRLELPGAPRLAGRLLLAPSLLALLLAGAFLGYGLLRLQEPAGAERRLRVLLIQQATDPWTEGSEGAVKANMDLAKAALASKGPRPDLVLFSESSLGYPFKDSPDWYETHPGTEAFLPWWRTTGLWLLTGSPVVLDWRSFSATNSVILVDPKGKPAGDYAKIHPVPFAEAIPFYEYPWFRDFLKRAVGLEAGWTMGSKIVVFSLPGPGGTFKFGAPICFEDAFAPLCRDFVRAGAEFLVNLTDDSWSHTESAEWQHLLAARFRAIETRRPLVRSTNSGVSGLVDPEGRIRDTLPLFSPRWGFVDLAVPPPRQTLYLAAGDWFALLCLLLSSGWGLMIVGRDWKVRREGT